MKTLILGDLHFGVKQDDPWMQNIQREFIIQAIDYSKSRGIKKWIQTGDWFDVRRAITHKTMEFNRQMVSMIEDSGIEVDAIVGNHDMQLKQKIHPNACTELLSQFKNFTVYDKITTVDYDGLKIDLCPWICDENKSEILEYVKTTDARWCIGHFELSGFYFYKGLKSNGDDPAFLRRYKQVLSGHFHTQSENRNVKFVGTPYSITSGDENDIRGFHVLDTETEELIFVPNNVMWHRRIDYPSSINPQAYKGLSVRVFVTKLDKQFTKFESDLESVVHDMKTVYKLETAQIEETAEDDTQVKSVLELMDEYIDCIPDISTDDSAEMKIMCKQLFSECSK